MRNNGRIRNFLLLHTGNNARVLLRVHDLLHPAPIGQKVDGRHITGLTFHSLLCLHAIPLLTGYRRNPIPNEEEVELRDVPEADSPVLGGQVQPGNHGESRATAGTKDTVDACVGEAYNVVVVVLVVLVLVFVVLVVVSLFGRGGQILLPCHLLTAHGAVALLRVHEPRGNAGIVEDVCAGENRAPSRSDIDVVVANGALHGWGGLRLSFEATSIF